MGLVGLDAGDDLVSKVYIAADIEVVRETGVTATALASRSDRLFNAIPDSAPALFCLLAIWN